MSVLDGKPLGDLGAVVVADAVDAITNLKSQLKLLQQKDSSNIFD